MPSIDSPYLAGMGKVSTQSLTERQNHAGLSRLHGDIGNKHEASMAGSTPGGRTYEFHNAAMNAHWNVSDMHFDKARSTVANISEPISTLGSRGTRTNPAGNYTGRYN